MNEAQSVADLTALLEEAKKSERIADEARRRERSATRRAFFATHPYVYTVSEIPDYDNPMSDRGFGNSECVEIVDVRRISRKIDVDKYAAFFCDRSADDQSIFSSEDLDKIDGINYYLTADGIIHHTGGGTIILKTPQLCSNEDWRLIKLGTVPRKFLRKGNNHE